MTSYESFVFDDVINYKKIVYFLKHGEEIVYVGMSLHGLTRPFSHQDKHYDTMEVFNLNHKTNREVMLVEERMIYKHLPKYNKSIKEGGVISVTTIKARLQNLDVIPELHDKRNLKKRIEEEGIDYNVEGKYTYLKGLEALELVDSIKRESDVIKNEEIQLNQRIN